MVNKTVYLYYNDTAWTIRKEEEEEEEKEEERLFTVADEDRKLQVRDIPLSYINSNPKWL